VRTTIVRVHAHSGPLQRPGLDCEGKVYVYVSRRAREAKRGHHSEANARMDGLVVSTQYLYNYMSEDSDNKCS
jgi:hypothetical protein